MAGIDSAQVYLPSPDQSATTGAVAIAVLGTTAPTDARTALGASWSTGGYVGEDGLTLSISRSTSAIKDWSQSNVRKALTDFDGTVGLSFLQVDEFAAKRVFGASNVTVTAANTTHGNELSIAIGAELPDMESWCFNMKDGDRRVRVYLPCAQVTEVGDVTFVPSAGNAYPATISCYPDASGKSIYVFYDDGQVTSV